MVEPKRYRLVVIVATIELCVILSMIVGIVTVAAGQSTLAGFCLGLSTSFVSIGTAIAVLNYVQS